MAKERERSAAQRTAVCTHAEQALLRPEAETELRASD